MGLSDLVSADVRIVVSDPWDFVTQHGSGPFSGKALRVGDDYWAHRGNAMLFQLKVPVVFKGITCEYVIRHEL